ncbi:putative phage abortive infection protein, partial [Acinetobacter sp. YK3]|uniref:putative phage abortive infection protein n=1 Tax=Acinetobacter sp. YK3 TaxID=1860097 RepID=UPI00084C200C
NKDLVKYLTIIGFIIALSSLFFLEDLGAFIPTMMKYFTGGKNITKDDLYIVNLGYFGSFLAGTLGLIFGFVNLIFLIFTFLEQSRKNEISEIENRIFKLIELLVEIKNQNNLSKNIQVFIENNKNISYLKKLKLNLKKDHLQFSNFFRMLYQILKYINENESIIHNKYCKKQLDKSVKSYTNIIRSYLDTNLLTCLAINCYCLEEENGEYNNYKKLLERYQLLEHLPNILPMQFSSYLYFNERAFGDSTWFKDFNSIRDEVLEISVCYKTRDFCEVFLLFLAKKSGKWKNEKAILVTSNNQNTDTFNLSISGINNEEIPRELNFKFLKEKSKENLYLSSSPFNISCNEFQQSILKSGNKLKLSYLKPNDSHSICYEFHISLLILSTDELEIDIENTSNSYCILPF